jgi:hypothetical protein
VDSDLKLEGESNTRQLPRTCNIAEAQGKGVKQILDLLHEQIWDGINRRDALAFEEDFEETEDNDDEGSGPMSEEWESEEESSKSEKRNVTSKDCNKAYIATASREEWRAFLGFAGKLICQCFLFHCSGIQEQI